jgi:hypothetical protein
MTRGNQREEARKKSAAKLASQVRFHHLQQNVSDVGIVMLTFVANSEIWKFKIRIRNAT